LDNASDRVKHEIAMPDQPFQPRPADDDFPEKPQVSTRDVIDEALQRQAARRVPPSPPREMPITPTLPRQPNPARDRKRKRPFER
jgi:hypothetical protein